MQPSEALGIAAQVAVTLAGFAGIVVVFRPESIHEWSALDRFRLQLLLANSSLPLVSSLFGILLLTIDPAPVAIWRWCSGFALLIQVPFILSSSAKGRRVPPAGQARVNKPLYYSIALLGTVALVLQVINVVAWNRFWPFFFLIFMSLGAAVAQFVRFVILPPHTE